MPHELDPPGSEVHDEDLGGELDTLRLLRRIRAGDRNSLTLLLRRDLAWVTHHVQRRLSGSVRATDATEDVVQDLMVRLLLYGVRVELNSKQTFRVLVGTMVRHLLCTRARQSARIPAASGGADTVLDLDRGARARTGSPVDEVQSVHDREWTRQALLLQAGPDQDLLRSRIWDGASFADIAGNLDISEDAARMRYQAALKRLHRTLVAIKQGRIAQILEQGDAADLAVDGQ